MAADRSRWLGLAMLSLGVALIIMDAAMVAAIFVLAGFALSFRIPNLIFYSKDETSAEQPTE